MGSLDQICQEDRDSTITSLFSEWPITLIYKTKAYFPLIGAVTWVMSLDVHDPIGLTSLWIISAGSAW